ncbi:MAG: methyltransferase [Candidatus Marsarchaeota archaeon]|nr:methyltransferase [Candidatus Marsarchaeota archaeon]
MAEQSGLINSIHIDVYNGVYAPREDSYLLANAVEKYANGNVLDLGTGTGILGIVAAKKGCNVTFADINSVALECAKHNAKINNISGIFIITDMFSNIKNKYDTIIFNPPYLDNSVDITSDIDIALDGGVSGRKYINILLSNFKNYVNKKYNILLLESSINKYEMDIKKYNAKIIASEKAFFEEIVILHIGD